MWGLGWGGGGGGEAGTEGGGGGGGGGVCEGVPSRSNAVPAPANQITRIRIK